MANHRTCQRAVTEARAAPPGLGRAPSLCKVITFPGQGRLCCLMREWKDAAFPLAVTLVMSRAIARTLAGVVLQALWLSCPGRSSYLAPVSGTRGSASRCRGRAARPRRPAAGSAPWGSRSGTRARGRRPRGTPVGEKAEPCEGHGARGPEVRLHAAIKAVFDMSCKAHAACTTAVFHVAILKNSFSDASLVKLENSQSSGFFFIIHRNNFIIFLQHLACNSTCKISVW